jgi:hypothetical protein
MRAKYSRRKRIDKELIRKWQIKNWKTCNYSDDGYIGTCLGRTIIGPYTIFPYKNRFYLVEFIFIVIEFYFLIWSFFPFLEVINYFSSLSSFNSNMLLLCTSMFFMFHFSFSHSFCIRFLLIFHFMHIINKV